MSGGGAVGGGRWEEVGVSRPPNFARGAANWASPSPQGRNSLALEAVNATVAPWFEVMRICAAEEGHEDGERQRQEGELRHRGAVASVNWRIIKVGSVGRRHYTAAGRQSSHLAPPLLVSA